MIVERSREPKPYCRKFVVVGESMGLFVRSVVVDRLRHNSGNRGHTANKAVCPLAEHANRIMYIYFKLFFK